MCKWGILPARCHCFWQTSSSSSVKHMQPCGWVLQGQVAWLVFHFFKKIFLRFLSVWFFNSLGTFRPAGVEVEWLYRLCDRTIALTAVSFFLICLTSVQLQRCSCTGIAQQGTYFVTWCPDSVRNWRTYLVTSLFWLYTCRKKGTSWSAFHNSVTQQCKKHYGNSDSEVKIKVLILKA